MTKQPSKSNICSFGLGLLIIILSCSNHSIVKMDSNFCQDLKERNNQELEKVVNDFLNTLDPKKSNTQNFQLIKEWIENHDCVVSVDTDNSLIDTDPPVKEFAVTLKGITKSNYIGIRVYPDQMKFDKK